MANTLTTLRTMRDYDRPERRFTTLELERELERARWNALEWNLEGQSKEAMELIIADMAREKERRERLAAGNPGNPLVPPWPKRDPDFRGRVDRVKQTWPLDEAVRHFLNTVPYRTGGGRSVISCPLGTHSDTDPSFTLFPDGHAHCFGCGWQGDVLDLIGAVYGFDSIFEKLEFLENVA